MVKNIRPERAAAFSSFSEQFEKSLAGLEIHSQLSIFRQTPPSLGETYCFERDIVTFVHDEKRKVWQIAA